MDDSQTARAIKALQASLEGKHEINSRVTQDMGHALAAIQDKVDKVLEGFPEGDPLSHRKYHEALIKRAEAKATMYREITADILKKGFWIALVGIGAILVKYFLQWVRGSL